jgi:hypothetical protein
MQEDINRLLLGFQPQPAAALARGGYSEISDIGAGFHGKMIAESAEGINYKPTFVT